jgi:hypothetical protein
MKAAVASIRDLAVLGICNCPVGAGSAASRQPAMIRTERKRISSHRLSRRLPAGAAGFEMEVAP